jgi:uncharacterized membrane protein YdbT with pleckstrin-like domain
MEENREGEETFYDGHPSWRSIVSFYFRGLLIALVVGVIVGIVTRVAGSSVNVALVVAAVLVVMVVDVVLGLIMRIATRYKITSQRLTIHLGILRRDMHETRIERVQNVNVQQTMMDRLLRVGTVTFDTAGEAGYDFAFRGVSNPDHIVRVVDKAIHDFQARAPGV